MSKDPRPPDFVVKTPCDGPEAALNYPHAKPTIKWRRIGEAWKNADGAITCRIDLPVQNCRVVLYPYHPEGDRE